MKNNRKETCIMTRKEAFNILEPFSGIHCDVGGILL